VSFPPFLAVSTTAELHTATTHPAALSCAPWGDLHKHTGTAVGHVHQSAPTSSELTTPPTFNCQAALSCCNVYDARRLTYDGTGADVTRIRHGARPVSPDAWIDHCVADRLGKHCQLARWWMTMRGRWTRRVVILRLRGETETLIISLSRGLSFTKT
jgi:hypothetical protein